MLDLLPPWVIRAAIVITGLALFDVLLYMLCARMERRNKPTTAITGNDSHI